jgi:photosystem II stability/assembly factor-like uncharacterized protein
VNISVETADGVFSVELETEEVEGFEAGARLEPAPEISTGLPRVVAAASSGATVVAVVRARPPLVVSGDAGRTWREAGGGLPQGHAIAISDDDPDFVVYAARNRLYISRDGGRFWHALAPELPEITAIALDA